MGDGENIDICSWHECRCYRVVPIGESLCREHRLEEENDQLRTELEKVRAERDQNIGRIEWFLEHTLKVEEQRDAYKEAAEALCMANNYVVPAFRMRAGASALSALQRARALEGGE